MKQARAITKYVRVSPTKARLAADLIRGKSVEDAYTQLMFCNLKSGQLLKKTLDSAVANAETQHNVQRNSLRISEVRVDQGPTLKRAKAKNKGGRVPIMKRSSHFTIVVEAE